MSLVLFLALLFTGCNESINSVVDNSDDGKGVHTEGVFEYLESLGFDTKNAVIDDEHIIVENCIEFNIEQLEHDMADKSRQWRHSYIVSQNNVATIKVKYDSDVPVSWQTATDQAIAEWNAINTSKIKLVKVNSGQDLSIQYETLSPTTTVARATFPTSSGDVGYRIRINTNYNNLSSSKKVFTMVHEFGHCLGMRHINNSESGRIQIPNTPTTDDNSVMHPYVGEWKGFSVYDRIAAQEVYPVGDLIALKAHANNKYVCAESDGNSPLIANRTAVGAWEKFYVVNNSDGTKSLVSYWNGKYVCAESGGNNPLIANRGAIGSWEKFHFSNNSDGTTSLKANANNKYVCAESKGSESLIANRGAIGSWEKFYVVNQ